MGERDNAEDARLLRRDPAGEIPRTPRSRREQAERNGLEGGVH